MSPEELDPEEPEERGYSLLNIANTSVGQYLIGLLAIQWAPDDPEETLSMALTQNDVCAILAALTLYVRVFPDAEEVVLRLMYKFEELGVAQKRFGFDLFADAE